MDVETIKKKIKELRTSSPKRNFVQTFDLIINLQQLDLKRPEHKVDVGITLNSNLKPKNYKICAVIDHGISGAEKVFDGVIYTDELQAMKGDIEKIRKITHNYDKFVVLVNTMPLFAQILGRYLGPMNKMPSPKLGMVISPKTDLKALYEKLQKTVLLQTKKNLVLQTAIGAETESDEVVAKNVVHIYDVLSNSLPNHKHNIKEVILKLTMGKGVRL